MFDLIDPFLTFASNNPDFNEADSLRDSQELAIRQGILDSVLRGEECIDTLLDCVEEHGIGADRYVQAVTANVDYVIDQGIRFTSNDAGLFLPERLI